MMQHLAASTLFGLVTLGCASVFRLRGSWRHALLLAAILRFAVPTGWLLQAGAGLAHTLPNAAHTLAAADGILFLLTPGASPEAGAVTGGAVFQPAGLVSSGVLLWLLWAVGLAGFAGIWLIRFLKRVPAVRDARARELAALRAVCAETGNMAALRIIDTYRAPGVCGLLRHVIVLPDGLSAELTANELHTVLAHELAHVQRRDNLTAAVAHLVVSVFWFHPLLWWLERCMMEARETACDELVLARGASVQDYACGLLKVLRMSYAGPAEYAEFAGIRWKDRVENIMSGGGNRVATRWTRSALGSAVICAALLPFVAGFLGAQQNGGNDPSNALFRSAIASLQTRQFLDAETAFRHIHEADSRDTRGLMGVAEVYMAQQRTDDAIRLLAAETAKDPGNPQFHLMTGQLQAQARRFKAAIEEFQTVLSIVEKNPQAAAGHPRVEPAQSKANADSVAAAVAALLPLANSSAKVVFTPAQYISEVYVRSGEAELRSGDGAAAIAKVRKAAEVAPGSAVFMNLAMLEEMTGQKALAMQSYQLSLRSNPDNAVALNNLAYLTADSGGDLDEALKAAQRAHALLPEHNEVADTLGWIYLKKKMSAEAVATLGAIVAQAPGNTEYRGHLVMALDQTNDVSTATEELKAALREKPSDANNRRVTELVGRAF